MDVQERAGGTASAEEDAAAPVPPTTVPPASPPAVPVPAPAVTNWPTSLYPCDGDYPPCYVAWRESHGDYNARNNSSYESACGKWQFILSTWRTVASWIGAEQYPTACDAPPEVQDAAARALWNGGAGCGAWQACG